MAPVTVPTVEYEERIDRVRDELAANDTDALCLFSPVAIEWVSGFHHLQTERPVCLAVTHDRVGLTVPRLELDRAQSDEFPLLDEVYHYYDYPGGTTEGTTYYEHTNATPEETISGMLADLDVATIVADMNGAPGYWGYSGPALDELADITVETVEWIEAFRESKSTVERELLRESAKWGNLAHRKLEEYVEPGKHELWIAKRASLDASMAMLDTLGERYDSRLRGGFPASCGFLSGPNTALPHGLTKNRRLNRGDVIITGASANVGGYITELERTMFVGEPSSTQRHYFEIMVESQEIALETIAPGVEYAAVEAAVTDYYEEQGVAKYMQCHVGHNIGLEGHERPYLDTGYEGRFRVGELFTPEPGFYVPDLGGFRHSDTVHVTKGGIERLTHYPRDIERLTISTE